MGRNLHACLLCQRNGPHSSLHPRAVPGTRDAQQTLAEDLTQWGQGSAGVLGLRDQLGCRLTLALPGTSFVALDKGTPF